MHQFDSAPHDEKSWLYNCLDCVYTREVGEVEAAAVRSMGLLEIEAFQQRLFRPVLAAMLRGVRIDLEARERLAEELRTALQSREDFFLRLLGHPLSPRSSPQMKALFYNDLKQPVVLSKGKKGKASTPTLDDKALETLANREPLLRPLIKAIQEYRSIGVFKSTFVEMPLDTDNRMRCSYNICGTETFRLSSATNAFGTGGNLQNIPKGDDNLLPNLRKLFIPDEGFVFFDMDLDRADLQVVVWECNDTDLKTVLRNGIDMHCFNACDIFDIKGIPLEELAETHPNYPDHRARIGEARRQDAKRGCHAVNYFCKERTLAQHLNCSVVQASRFITKWLSAHPGIAQWHKRTEQQLQSRRYVENPFGYRRYYFDRPESLLPEALAWVPQSTVACVINRAWVNIFEQAPEIQVLLQVHDSLAGQFAATDSSARERLTELSRIPIPYPDPLTIPVGIKTSPLSWGDCK